MGAAASVAALAEEGVVLGRGSRGVGGGGKGAEEGLNAMAYNNSYVEGRWGLFRSAGSMRLITHKASLASVELPTSPVEPTCKACPAFHIKGMCNTGYRKAADHVPHTQEQDLPLWGWSVRAMPEITAPGGVEYVLPVPTTNPAPSVRTRAHTTPSPDTQSTTTKKWQPLGMKTLEPDTKRPTQIPRPQQVNMLDDIGKYVVRNAEEVTRLGWTEFVHLRWESGDFASLSEVEHQARRLLHQYKHCGAPVMMMTGEWTEGERLAALKRGPHNSSTEHAPFLREEFASMVEKGQLTVISYLVAKRLP